MRMTPNRPFTTCDRSTFYVVMDSSQRITYRGWVPSREAIDIAPGSVCGFGKNENEARWNAIIKLGKLRRPEPRKPV